MKEQETNPALPLDEKIKQLLLTGDAGNFEYLINVLSTIREQMDKKGKIKNDQREGHAILSCLPNCYEYRRTDAGNAQNWTSGAGTTC